MTSIHRRALRGSMVFVLVASLVGVAPGLTSSPTQASSGRPFILAPGAKHFGTSYNELAGAWWSWAVQFPLSDNPITADGGTDCSRGQSGKIWFLAGNFGGAAGEPNPANRTCAIPSGKALFIPLANGLFFAPEDGADIDAVRRGVNLQIDAITELELRVDGVAIADPFAYRASSPPGGFALHFGPLLADFGLSTQPDPREPAVADGYWVLLAPLTRGLHEIQIRSGNAAGFAVDVTYVLTVGR